MLVLNLNYYQSFLFFSADGVSDGAARWCALSGARACIGIALTSGPGPNSDAKERRRDNGDARHHSIISLSWSAGRALCVWEWASAPPTAERASVGTARFLTKSLSQPASKPACYLFISLSVLSARWPPANTQSKFCACARSLALGTYSVQGDAKGTNNNSDTFNSSAFSCARNWVTGNEICRSSSLFFKSKTLNFLITAFFTVFYKVVRLCKCKII